VHTVHNLPPPHTAGHRVNCADNPLCYYGLGEGKLGVWQRMPSVLASLGPNPALEERVPDAMPTGLRNMGGTCYFNTLMQGWYHILPFRAAVRAWTPRSGPGAGGAGDGDEVMVIPDSDRPSTGPSALDVRLMTEFQRLFGEMATSPRRWVSPDRLVQVLGLDPHYQQDLPEFHTLLMSRLDAIFAASTHLPLVLQRIIPLLFGGVSVQTITCRGCGNVSRGSPQQFYDLVRGVVAVCFEHACEGLHCCACPRLPLHLTRVAGRVHRGIVQSGGGHRCHAAARDAGGR